MLVDKHQAEIEAIIERYPIEHKRAAVMPLLYLAQREYGYLPQEAIDEVAGLLDLDPTQVGGLVRFYTLYHEKPGGKYRIQICTDLPCALRGAEAFAEEMGEELGIAVNETTEDGLFTVEHVMCLAACHRAPMFQVQEVDGIHYHENQTIETARAWIQAVREAQADG